MALPKDAQYRAPALVNLWFFVSTFIVFWDSGFMLLRPRSMPGGDLYWLWRPYALYATIDYVYGVKAFERGDGFGPAQSILNLFENACNFGYLYLAWRKNPIALLVGYSGALATFWKTVLYWLMDQQCGWCQTGHNSRWNWWILFFFPNIQWIFIPFVIMIVFGRQIARSLIEGSKQKKL